MLGLAEQVGGDDHGIGRLVGDDEDLGRAGDEVDADLPEEPALRLDDVRVARPDEEVDRVDRLGAERERGQRLDAAEDVDLVGAREVHGGDGRVRHAPVERRRAGRDPLDARDLRRDDAHVRGRDHRVAAAGHVGADALDRDVPVAEPDARERLDLEVESSSPAARGRTSAPAPGRTRCRRAPGPGPARGTRRSRRRRAGSAAGSQPSRRGRVAPHGGVSVCGDGGDDLVDDLRDGIVVASRARCVRVGVLSVCTVASSLAVTTYA